MKITVSTYSFVRSACGFQEKQIECADNSSVHDIMEKLFLDYADLAKMKGKLLFAVNEVYSLGSQLLNDGDRLAIFPPVSGG
jgi:molybdopterin converting factor small subunit